MACPDTPVDVVAPTESFMTQGYSLSMSFPSHRRSSCFSPSITGPYTLHPTPSDPCSWPSMLNTRTVPLLLHCPARSSKALFRCLSQAQKIVLNPMVNPETRRSSMKPQRPYTLSPATPQVGEALLAREKPQQWRCTIPLASLLKDLKLIILQYYTPKPYKTCQF